jgi:hypothetical protein
MIILSHDIPDVCIYRQRNVKCLTVGGGLFYDNSDQSDCINITSFDILNYMICILVSILQLLQ